MAMWDTTAKFLVLQTQRGMIRVPEPLRGTDSLLVKMLSKLRQAYGEFAVSYDNTDHGAQARGSTHFREARALATKASAYMGNWPCA